MAGAHTLLRYPETTMFDSLKDPHRRHILLTVVVGVGLAAYLSGTVESITIGKQLDLAMLLALAGGFPVYFGALTELVKRNITADLAVSLAAFAAMAIGEYAVAVEVIFIMLVGEALENYAIRRTRSGIAALLALRPHEARVRRAGADHDQVVSLDKIRPDDVVLLRPGDRIPVDGRVLGGSSSVDQSPITGESLPADKTTGDEVFAGTINLYGAMEIAVERLGKDTTLERIIHLVEEAEAAKAPTQRLADRYAAWFVPIVLLTAGLVYLLSGEIIRSVSVLVVACPCALVLATPTAIAAGIGALVRRGVLVKGGTSLEKLGRLRAVVFDKTGTLTLAKLRIVQIVPADGHEEEDVLRAAAAVERHSEHPIGQLIVDRAAQRKIIAPEATDFTARPGLGAEAAVDGSILRVGSPRFLHEAGVALPADLAEEVDRLGLEGCTVVLAARDDRAIGAVAVADTIRPEARSAVRQLAELGIERIAMLTGDNAAAAQPVADALNIKEVQSGLLPADKVKAVRRIQTEAAPVAMVGDGINDAPSLVTADVGVAMAQIGTDVAIASADVILVGDDLRKLATAIACGRETLRIIWQNILGFAVAFNVLAVVAASLGWVTPWVAAVLHQVSSLTVVLNSMRLLIDRARWRLRWNRFLQTCHRRRRPAVAMGAGLAVAVYLMSGIHVVSVGEVGVVQHFGKLVEPLEEPGLHVRLPYPIGRHWIVRPDESRRVEIGFRTLPGAAGAPAAYEWNVQHRGGALRRMPREADVLAGDENLVDVNLIVQYRLDDPLAALFAVGQLQSDGKSKWDALVRGIAEAALRAEMSRRPIEAVLGPWRADVEETIRRRVDSALRQYGAGIRVEGVFLADVHPPVEVVPAFRQVAAAAETKEAAINEARAFAFKTTALARGAASRTLLDAQAAASDRTLRAKGDAARFVDRAAAHAEEPELARQRLYLETIERLLADRRKIILDQPGDAGRRRVFLGTLSRDIPPSAAIIDELLDPSSNELLQGTQP